MNIQDLSDEEFAEHMRRKRENETEGFDLPDPYHQNFSNGVSLRIQSVSRKVLSEVLGEENKRWAIRVSIPRMHPLYGKELGFEMFEDLALDEINYFYEAAVEQYVIAIKYTGTPMAVKNVAHTVARRVAHATARPTSEGINTTTKMMSAEERLVRGIPPTGSRG